MNASFEEKSAWIMLISQVVVFGFYFWMASDILADGASSVGDFVPLFILVVVLLITVMTVGHIAVAIASRPEGPDERDRTIAWRAQSNSSWVLAVGILAGITAVAIWGDKVWTAHVLLLFLVVAEIVKSLSQIVYYRRGLPA